MSTPSQSHHGEPTVLADNFFEMIESILVRTRQSPEKVWCDDDPFRREIGFTIGVLRWRVRLTNIIRRGEDPGRFAPYESYVKSAQGREALASLLSKGLEPTEEFKDS